HCARAHPDLPSFPTRRSSDLMAGDSFPAVFTGVRFTATQTGGASGFTANGSGNINDTVTMPGGSVIVYTATGTIDPSAPSGTLRSEEHTSELQSLRHLVCRLL